MKAMVISHSPMLDQDMSIMLQFAELNIALRSCRKLETRNWMMAAMTTGIDM